MTKLATRSSHHNRSAKFTKNISLNVGAVVRGGPGSRVARPAGQGCTLLRSHGRRLKVTLRQVRLGDGCGSRAGRLVVCNINDVMFSRPVDYFAYSNIMELWKRCD